MIHKVCHIKTGLVLLILLFSKGLSLHSQHIVQVGDGNIRTNISPFVPFYSYGYSQEIFPNSILHFFGKISKLSLYSSADSAWSDTVQVYLGHTDLRYYSDPYPWIDPNSLDLVYSGKLTFQKEGWTDIVLDTAFEYDGTKNLVLAFNNKTGQFASGVNGFFLSTIHDQQVSNLSYFSNDQLFNLGNPQSYNLLYYHQLNMKFEGDLKYLSPEFNTVYLESEAGSLDTLSIQSSISDWNIIYDSQSWLEAVADPSNNRILLTTIASNTTNKFRIIQIQIISEGLDTVSVKVKQEPSLNLIPYTDIMSDGWASSKELGDFDNDGDLDILVASAYDNIKLLKNMGDFHFAEQGVDFSYMKDASIEFGDIDNDNDLDILITGYYYDDWEELLLEPVALVYINMDNEYILAEQTGLKGLTGDKDPYNVLHRNTLIEDLNNDGFLDVVLSGTDLENDPETILYLNNKDGSYAESGQHLIGLDHGNVHSVDIDNDSDWDILYNGDDLSANHVMYLALNNDGIIENQRMEIQPQSYATSSAVDINLDGISEVIYGGSSGIEIYQSTDGFKTHSKIQNLPGRLYPEIIQGNIEGNAEGLNILISDLNVTSLYNAGKDNFRLDYNDTLLMAGSGNWGDEPVLGDLDNDGDLDIITGDRIYRNNIKDINIETPVPENLSSEIIDGIAYLHWEPGEIISGDSLYTYNIYIGTSPDSCNMMSPMSDLITGYRKIPADGNTGNNTAWKIRDLSPGTYYWAVQSVNSVYLGSRFSSVESFEVKQTFANSEIAFQEDDFDEGGCWVDFDNDGDMDVIAVIKNRATIYENIDAEFVLADTIGQNVSLVEPADLNKDNLIDLVVITSTPEQSTVVFDTMWIYFQSPDHNFYLYDFKQIPAVAIKKFILVDFNNDTKLDAFYAGYKRYPNWIDQEEIGIIYDFLDSHTFNNMFFPIDQYFRTANCDLADLNQDGYMDIFATGPMSDLTEASFIFFNMSGAEFNPERIDIPGYRYSAIESADMSNDGYLDLIIMGAIDQYAVNETAIYYFDEKQGTFKREDSYDFPGVINGSMTVNDINNDGWMDFVIGGIDQSSALRLYVNDAKGGFNYKHGELHPDWWDVNSLEFGDFDADGDKDLLVFGYDKPPHPERINLITNSTNKPDSRILPPINLKVQFSGQKSIFTWEDSIDNGHDDETYFYNIRLGTEPGAMDIICPLTNVNTGKVMANNRNNAGYFNMLVLNDLPIGDYYWSIQAVDQSNTGGEWSKEHSFNIKYLHAGFTHDTVCAGIKTTFSDTSTNIGSVTYNTVWDFGDGNSSILANPTHLYQQAGTYLVKQTIQSNHDIDSIIAPVIVKQNPLVDFMADPVCHGIPNPFMNNSQSNGTNITNWYWSFGDGTHSSKQEPGSHGYFASGDYEAKLYAFSENGCADSVQKTVQVVDAPVAAITIAGLPSICIGDSLELSSIKLDQVDYQWRLNGASIAGADSSWYMARNPGSYTLELKHKVGNCISVSEPLHIETNQNPPIPEIIAQGTLRICKGDSLIISSAYNPNLDYHWRLNGGAVGYNSNVLFAKNTGRYNLLVSNDAGCISTSKDTFIVDLLPSPEKPVIKLSGPESFCSGDSVILSIPNPLGMNVQWMNKSESINDVIGKDFTTRENGNYRVEVSNEYGCKNRSEEIKVTVYPNPEIPVLSSENYTPDACPSKSQVLLEVTNPDPETSYFWRRNGIIIDNALGRSMEGFLTEANYSVKADLNGCISESLPYTIQYADLPPQPGLLAEGPNVWYLACTNDSAAEYTWYFNNEILEDVKGSIYVANDKLGKYQVSIASHINGCHNFSTPVWIPTTTGIAQNPLTSLRIYPNPTEGLIHLDLDHTFVGELILDVYSPRGDKIKTLKTIKRSSFLNLLLDLSSQPGGIYVVRVSMGPYSISRKIILN